ncbi:deoxynucleoside kinase [Candidatus Micrarchaeota archaeon]|nr:deoxynucleoside kinase [Candidatus Micrarchaeota archaeon]
MFVLFEGGDGTGKSTLIDKLNKKFDFTLFRYPTDKFPMLRDHLDKRLTLNSKSLFLTFLADIANEQNRLELALGEGNVFMDRYVLSTIAYENEGVSFNDAKEVVSRMDFIQPDLVVLLDLEPEEAHRRKKGQKSPDRYESDIEFLKKVRKNFLKLSREKFLCRNWKVIDASQPLSGVFEDAVTALSGL